MNQKTKYMYIIIIILVIVICIIYNREVTNFSSAAGTKLSKITKVSLYYGRPGQKGVILTDKNDLEKIKNKLEKMKLIKLEDQPVIVGYYQAGKLYENNEIVTTIIFGNPIQINGIYYKVVGENLKTSEIDQIINSK